MIIIIIAITYLYIYIFFYLLKLVFLFFIYLFIFTPLATLLNICSKQEQSYLPVIVLLKIF